MIASRIGCWALLHFTHLISVNLISGNFTQLAEFVSKGVETLVKNSTFLDNALATFDMQQHSLGVLGILWVSKHDLICCWEVLNLVLLI